MRVLNSIAPETAALIRARIAGKPMPPAIAKAPKAQPVKCYVTQLHRVYTETNTHVVQLPIAFNRAHYNSSRTPWYLKEAAIKSMREMVWLALSSYFPSMRAPSFAFSRIKPSELKCCAPSYVRFVPDDERAVRAFCESARAMRERARVRQIEFVRLAINKLDERDNLPAAFKAITDATCSYLVHGSECRAHIKTIGRADDILDKRGLTWSYRQQKCESNPRLYGVRIILHVSPLDSGAR
jgi:hypothetical protein